MREIIFETETTGLSPLNGDRIVEIGCVEMINRCETGRFFHSYFNPGRPMPSDAEAVHGLSDRFLSDKPAFDERCEELLGFIGDSPMIAHNAAFDFGFINHELGECGRSPVCMSRMVCTLALARQKFPGAKHSLDALCTRFGVDRSQRIKHGALVDAQLLAQVYVELAGGRQIALDLQPEPIEIIPALEEAAAELLKLRDLLATVVSPLPHRGIGHNRPPNQIRRENAAVLEHGAIASVAATAELKTDSPRPDILGLCLRALRRAMALLKEIATWLGIKANIFIDEGMKSAGKALGPAIIVVVAHLTGLLEPIIQALRVLSGN